MFNLQVITLSNDPGYLLRDSVYVPFELGESPVITLNIDLINNDNK